MDRRRILIDQMKRPVELPQVLQKVVSVVPSQTELLWDLGINQSLAGITKYCVHPSFLLKEKQIVGGTKNLNFNKLKSINPDLILANKEENTQSEIEALSKLYPVWITDIITLEDSLKMIADFGGIFGVEEKSTALIYQITEGFKELPGRVKPNKKVLYFIWRKPYMVAGSGCFINTMMQKCGLTNAMEDFVENERYVTLLPEQIKELSPDYIFLSSEPFPFKPRHHAEIQKICPNAQVMEVDGEMFSWYGSRLRYAPSYFRELLTNLD